MSSHESVWVLFGTQRAGPGTGFSRSRFHLPTGALSPPALVAVADDPAYFVVNANSGRLYTCNSGTPGGVSAYAVDGESGDLSLLNSHVSQGRGPSHLSLDRTGRYVLAANYGGGYVEVLAIASDGSLGPQTACVQHRGRGLHPERQSQPHPHCVRLDPQNHLALVADLGLDRVCLYRFHAGTGTLTSHDPGFVSVAPGSGPRHFVWHPDGHRLYLVEELSSAVTVLAWETSTGMLREIQTIGALPADYRGPNTSAEIVIHPRGHALYVSNRGHDSVACFPVDTATGHLGRAQHVPSGGRTPRCMALDPTGRWLLVTNHDSDSVGVFEISDEDGRPRPHDAPLPAPRPYGLAFIEAQAVGL